MEVELKVKPGRIISIKSLMESKIKGKIVSNGVTIQEIELSAVPGIRIVKDIEKKSDLEL